MNEFAVCSKKVADSLGYFGQVDPQGCVFGLLNLLVSTRWSSLPINWLKAKRVRDFIKSKRRDLK